MSAKDIAARVSYADEVHQNKGLSELIQRQLKLGRGRKIAQYLQSNEDRFFNSLVIAVYGGSPTWHELGDIRAANKRTAEALTEETKYSIGFLSLDGAERLFALDGQHRLAGIKMAVAKSAEASDDEISIILVGHSNSQIGLRRTRKLFTTLNKTAKPVSKAEIIILDESDAMAITTRRMVEKGGLFSGNRISFDAQANIRPDDQQHITTIINLYDVLTILFSKIGGLGSPSRLRLDRPDDSSLDNMLDLSASYFRSVGKYVRPFGEFMNADDRTFASIVARYRTPEGGNLLFRPIRQNYSLRWSRSCVRKKNLLMLLSSARRKSHSTCIRTHTRMFYRDSGRGGIERKAETHAQNVLLYMLGVGTQNEATLRERRAGFLGRADADPPCSRNSRLVSWPHVGVEPRFYTNLRIGLRASCTRCMGTGLAPRGYRRPASAIFSPPISRPRSSGGSIET